MTAAEQKLADLLKNPSTYSGTQSPYGVVSDWYSKQKDEFTSKIGNSVYDKLKSSNTNTWKTLLSGQTVDLGNGYTAKKEDVWNKSHTTMYYHYKVINPEGKEIFDTTQKNDFTNQARYAIGNEQGYLVGSSSYDTKRLAFKNVAKELGLSTTDLEKWKTTAYDDWNKIQTANEKDYGTFINNAGMKAKATSLEMLKNFKTLGFPQVVEGKDKLTTAEQAQIDQTKAPAPEFERKDLQLIADGKAKTVDEANTMVNEANPNFNAGPITVTPNPSAPSAPIEDPMVWVQKGPNKLQMAKSAVDALVAKGEGTIIPAPSQEEITKPAPEPPATPEPPAKLPAKYVYKKGGNYIDQDGNYIGSMTGPGGVADLVGKGAMDYGSNPPVGVTPPKQTLTPQPPPAPPVTQPPAATTPEAPVVPSEPVVPTNPVTPAPDTFIPFRSGLSDAQKNSIIELSKKPIASWSATDKSNWNWATNSSPLPTAEEQTKPAEPITPTAPPAPAVGSDTFIPFRDGLSDAQKQSIIDLYNKPADQWSGTDTLNWKWATNNAPAPTVTAPPVVPTAPLAGSDTMIPFRDGLSDAQRKSITDLYNKPPEQWSSTDKLNWQWATNNAPMPTAEAKPAEPVAPAAPLAGSDTLIPFKDGLNDTQRNSLIALYNKPAAEWTDTDKLNWQWGTNNAPMPTAPKAPEQPVTPQALDFTGIPEADQAIIKRFPVDKQQDMINSYNAILLGNSIKGKQAAAALDEAIKIADPYYRSQLLMAKDDVTNAIASNQQDVLSKIGEYQTRINQVQEDLTYGKEQLTLEQQAQMGDLLRTYKANLTDLSQQAAEQGLAFSSPRQLAEQRLREANQSSAEALSMKSAQALRTLETQSLRDTQTAQQGITDITRQGAENAASIWAKGEAAIGTANMLPGQPTLGTKEAPISGTIEQQRQQAILDAQNAIINRQDPIKFGA